MTNLFQNLAKSSLIAALALAPLLGVAEGYLWRGYPITYTGAERKVINPGAANEELILIFKNTSGTLTLPEVDVTARILAVGGGGAGGTTTTGRNRAGGGGGAGEFVDRDGITLNGQTLSIFVGAGGPAPASKAAANGNPGQPSYIQIGGADYLRVNGGGGGGSAAGQSGGSGGGAGYSGSAKSGGAADKNNVDGLGNRGGDSVAGYGGGGGGASGVGAPGSDDKYGYGGAGKLSDITGEESTYAGGGGGGSSIYEGGAGGAGGGGAGGGYTEDGDDLQPIAGTPNTGSGGGGGGQSTIGAAGGSGIIVIRLTGVVKALEWVEVPNLPKGWSKIEVATQPQIEWQNGELLLTYNNVADASGFRVANGLVKARALLIGGGGAGGTGYSGTAGNAGPGGGGAGGFVETNDFLMSGEYKIVVGAGGAAATTADIATGKPGADGGFTQIVPTGTIDAHFYQGGKAEGGGGGGIWGDGRVGGSGGGGSGRTEFNIFYSGQGGQGTDGQGHNGAVGNQFNVGGGGGGAGEAAPAIGADMARGGDGKTSNITGSDEWYAGGGGGSRKDLSSGDFSGGQGGGGQGGSYIKIENLDGVDGKGGGGGGGNQVLQGGKGGNGVVIIRISACVPLKVPVPKGHSYTYDGTEKRGVDESIAYDQGGEVTAVNADDYVAVVTIKGDLPEMVQWDDATGGQGPRPIDWAIHPMRVTVPAKRGESETFVFNDIPYQVIASVDEKKQNGGVDSEGRCWTNGLNYCTIVDHIQINACRTNFVVTLCNDYASVPNVTNFVWSGVSGTGGSGASGETPLPPLLAPVKVPWSIAQATNEVTKLTLGDWQEGVTALAPASKWKWEEVTKRYPHPDRITYQWRKEGSTDEWSEAKPVFDPPTEAGRYELRAYICADSNHPAPHEGGNWCAAEKVISFCVWRHPSKMLTDYVDITLDTKRVNQALKVSLAEASGASGLHGFTYARAGADGGEIRFVAISNLTVTAADAGNPLAGDELLAYTNKVWNVDGTSEVWVMLPTNGTTGVRMYWRRKVGVSEVPPDKLAQGVSWPQTASLTGTFGLVNQEQPDLSRAWVNWWKTEPAVRRYWDTNTLDEAKWYAGTLAGVNRGTLADGVITNKFTLMPHAEPVRFPNPAEKGAYQVEFYQFGAADGTAKYPGVHILYDGTRTFDFEIIGHDPQPIDPDGPEGSTLSGRVLTANDDTNATRGVALQAYWRTIDVDNPYWVHVNRNPPAMGVNLLPGSVHALRHVVPKSGELVPGEDTAVTNDLWLLYDVYVGNLMTNDNAVADDAALSNRWNTLPWSPTAKANRAKDAPFKRSEVAHLYLRNLADAEIRSQVFTNGVGTVYFDAVNVYAGADVDPNWYGLAVEVEAPRDDGVEHWERVPLLPFDVDGAAIVTNAVAAGKGEADWPVELRCLNYRNGGDVSGAKFCRVCAKINRLEPVRVRIVRTSTKVDAGGLATDEDDVDGFIAIDNVIASWPAPVPKLVPTGSYDPTRITQGAPVLGVEGAFSVAYPTVGDQVFATVRIDGGAYTNIASARLFYRWRYVDTDFDPARVNGRDNWRVAYFNVTNASFSTVSPLVYRQLPGDIEYYYDLTAFVPYYEYCDYSGRGLEAELAKLYGEEPDKYSAVHSDFEQRTGQRYPSNGADWFVRLREFPNEQRGWTLYVKRSEAEDAPVEALPLEMLSATEWRACCATTQAVAKLCFRLESERPEGSQVERIHTVTNCWKAESATALPQRLPLTATGSRDAWATVPCDAKTGCLMFLVDEARGSVTVAHADRQDFNRWSSAVNTNELFVGSSVDTNATSAVAKEYLAPVKTWPLSVATNKFWNEDFKVGGGEVASVIYPRNEPFKNKRTGKGWTAVNAMWTYGKWALQNKQDASASFADDSAVQLTGCGYGSLSFADAANAPDGLDTIRYTARVAQYNDGNSVSFYSWYWLKLDGTRFVGILPATSFTNYTFATCAALTETGAESFDGDGSMSLVGYYDRGKGFYEFRVSRGWNSTAIRLSLFRWRVSGGGMVCEKLLDENSVAAKRKNFFEYDSTSTVNIGRVVKGVKTPLGGLFLSVMENAGATLVTAGVREGDVSTITGPEAMSGQKFTCITYNDKSTSRLTAGTFGVMSANCPAVFVKPVCYMNGVSSYKPTKNNYLQGATGKAITFTGSTIDSADMKAQASWSLNPGRIEMLTDHVDCWGLQAAPVTEQKVYVQVSEAGKDEWTDVKTNVVKSYTSDTYTIPIRDARKLAVRLQMGGGPNDVRTDVAVNDVELTQWNGQWAPNWDVESIWHYLKDEFAYTSAWVEDDAWGVRGVRLQPGRARSVETPVSIRTPLMRGLGLIHFKWRNADPRAKLKVQVNELATESNVKNLTETMAGGGQGSASWETVETIDFARLPKSGEKSIYVNRRWNGWDNGRDYYRGMIRIVVDEEVVATAKAVAKTDPLYGSLEIEEAYAWDLPEYDVRSWSGWNFRAAGWTQSGKAADGSADRWANLADGFHGLSGLLNNTLDESTLADREKGHYSQKVPHVQSPAFQTNCVAAVSFRARLYEPEDVESHGYPAVVTVYGTRILDAKGEPVEGSWEEAGDVLVSNRVYATHTVKLKASSEFKAIRIGIKGVKGVTATGTPVYDPPLRVALDDICIWERSAQALSFRKNYVRPFRDAQAIKRKTAVADIASAEEQPLAGEAFGFQAEVEVQDPDEVLVDDPAHPITVELWYYPGAEPWGFENWKTNAGAIRVAMLPQAEGEKLIFRSTVDVTTSLCPPQLLADGETHKIVQYQVIAHYYDRSFDEGLQPMTRDMWATPSWYAGFADPNAAANQFSAFTLLERLAPGRAWINEVNFCEPTLKASNASQWFELAVPSGEDMTGWKVTGYDYEGNKVGVFAELGYRGMPKAKTYAGAYPERANHYAFYVVKGPNTVLDKSQYDATWSSSVNGNGTLEFTRPYAFELTRPTGVVEHRAVVQGWNQSFGKYWYAFRYEGTNLVEVMNAKQNVDSWVWGGEDLHGEADAGMTVGVVTNQGQRHVEWVSPMQATPGEVNVGQYIDPNWLTHPNGGYVWIYSNVVGEHLWQIIGTATNKVGSITLAQGNSTNITFLADRWYGLGTCQVTPSERTVLVGPSPADKDGRRTWRLDLNLISNRIDIVAKEGVAEEVEKLIDPKYKAYRPAIMKWLEAGVTGGADGGAHPFKNPNGPIVPAWYRGNSFDDPLPDNATVSNKLDLVGMYWLDIDPTEGAWELWGGMGDRPGAPGSLGPVDMATNHTRIVEGGRLFTHTNHLTTVWLELYNTNSLVSYPPYRLQGLGNEQSDLFTGAWTSVNFKVTMRLANGKVDNIFQPMRYFVFDKNSFRGKDDELSPYAARVEITDPFSRQSPAWEWGWPKYSDCPVFTGWGLDGRVTPGGVSTLKKNDTFEF